MIVDLRRYGEVAKSDFHIVLNKYKHYSEGNVKVM